MLNEIENAIIRKISNVASQLYDAEIHSNRIWTQRILESLADLGKENNCNVCPCKEDLNPEWLYDLVWYNNDSEDLYLDEVLLVVESEWSNNFDDIRYDFEKLLQARSSYKAMILDGSGNYVLLQTYIKRLDEIIQKSKLVNEEDRFLIALLNEDYEFVPFILKRSFPIGDQINPTDSIVH